MECEHDKETVLVSDSSAILTADIPETLNLLNSLTNKVKGIFYPRPGHEVPHVE